MFIPGNSSIYEYEMFTFNLPDISGLDKKASELKCSFLSSDIHLIVPVEWHFLFND